MLFGSNTLFIEGSQIWGSLKIVVASLRLKNEIGERQDSLRRLG